MGTRLWAIEDSSILLPMGEADWKRCRYRRVWNDNSRHKELGYRDEPFVLAKDVTQVFIVQDMSHIVLAGKRKIVGVDDVTDEEEYNKVEDITPFAVEVDTSILLAQEEARCARHDHNEGMIVKGTIINIPLVE